MTFREPTLFALAALRDQPMHGYGLAARVREITDGRVELTAGTLYGALRRLLDTELVEVDHEETVNSRRRRYYRLTDQGMSAIATELARVKHAMRDADRIRLHIDR